MKPVIAGLYVISSPPASDSAITDWLDRCEAAMQGGASLFQYRDKHATDNQRRARASALLERCQAHKVPLIINDDVHLAAAVGAAGVHLGQGDGSLAAARALLGPEAIIGASCYQHLERAEHAQSAGADYVAFGAAFSSPTKPDAPCAPRLLFVTARRRLNVPVVAIGGIHAGNASRLARLGVDAIAVISAVMAADDPRLAARRLCQTFGVAS